MTPSLSPVLLGASLIDVNPGLTFWTIITFIIVALILRVVAWKPILGFIQEREKAIADSIDAAKLERAEAEKMVLEQKANVTRIQNDLTEQARRNNLEMEKMREDMMKRSRQESDELLASARRTIDSEMDVARADIRREAVEIALAATEHLMKSSASKEEQERLVTEFIQALDGGKLVQK